MISPERQPTSRVHRTPDTILQLASNTNKKARPGRFNPQLNFAQTYFDPYRPTPSDAFGETQLLRALRLGKRQRFLDLYKQEAEKSQVNQFMFNLFAYGNCWHPAMRLPEYLYLKDSSGKTCLHYAAAGGANLREGYFKTLVDKFQGETDARGCSALMIAAVFGNLDQVRVLRPLEAGIQDINGCTALMAAAKKGQIQVVEELIPDECTICDNRGFIFIDYLDLKRLDQATVDRIEAKTRKHFAQYQGIPRPEPPRPKPTPPDMLTMEHELREQIDLVLANIRERMQ